MRFALKTGGHRLLLQGKMSFQANFFKFRSMFK